MPAPDATPAMDSRRPPGAGGPTWGRLPFKPAPWLLPLLLLPLLILASCAKEAEIRQPLASQGDREAEADALLGSDPLGPIPKPSIPAKLGGAAGPAQEPRAPGERIEYTLEVLSPDLPQAAEIFMQTAELSTMKYRPLNSPYLLAARLRSGIKTGQDILHSLGYYEGVCEGRAEGGEGGGPTRVVISLAPGPLYRIGASRALVAPGEGQAPPPPGGYPGIGLADAGLKEGEPAVASDILRAVGRLPELFWERGYPDAALSGSRYTLDKGAKTLEVEATVDPGPFLRMGGLVVLGDNPVRPGFIENSVNWARGQPWDQGLVESFQGDILQRGLFKQAAVGRAGADNPDGTRDITLDVRPAPFRTVSGSVNYDSDFGPGMDIAWEHRNLTGWGDHFRVELPVWEDLQQLSLQYSRPYFFSKRQIFLANMSFLNERADSYNLRSMSASAGVERQLSRHLRGTALATLETGSLDEFVKPREEYVIVGLPLTLDWDWSNDLLDPTRGHRLKLSVAPYEGHYTKDFAAVKSRLDAFQYFSLREDGFLVAALRLSVGAISGEDPSELPTSMRFFSGGGGSVRGFRYQSIGPRNDRGNPAGGGFLTEGSGELRWRFSDSMGVTMFVDAGMLYDKFDADSLGRDILYGGGLGFRYYTPVGPFRVDLATPLNPRPGDPEIQLYISLGQSF